MKITRCVLLFGAVIFIALMAGACGSSSTDAGTPDVDSTIEAAVVATIVAKDVQGTVEATMTAPKAAVISPTPTTAPPTQIVVEPQRTPTITPVPEPLSAADLFAAISPSVAVIEAGGGHGSGVLIDGGFIVTNAHVVWPYHEVGVSFPDGTKYPGTPVKNVDVLRDLAVLGPVTTDLIPVQWADDNEPAIGDDVYLLGYPVDQLGQPTITSGILSKFREWPAAGMTYLQSDAAVDAGQSGGALLSADGRLLGISTFSYGLLADFVLAASALDTAPLVEQLIAQQNVSGLGDRPVPLIGGDLTHVTMLRNIWDTRVYVVNERPGAFIEVEVESPDIDVYFVVVDLFGNVLLTVDEVYIGTEYWSGVIENEHPLFLIVGQVSESEGSVSVSSNVDLANYSDGDDGRYLSVGNPVVASVDYPGDVDYFLAYFQEGQTVEVAVESMAIDPEVTVDFFGALLDQVVSDDDSGGGIFSTDAKLVYKAPHNGSYFIAVSDVGISGDTGGYVLTIQEAQIGAVPVHIPASPVVVEGPHGEMYVYENSESSFSIQFPASWSAEPASDTEFVINRTSVSSGGELFMILEEDLIGLGLGVMTLDDYVDLVIDVLIEGVPGFELLSRQLNETSGGQPVEILFFSSDFGSNFTKRMISVTDEGYALNATYATAAYDFQDFEALIDYSFSTFTYGVD